MPIEDKKVKMYVCGVTVYDDIHMGHARSIIVFDMIARYLRYQGLPGHPCHQFHRCGR